MKVYKPGRVAIVLSGKHAGKKCVIVKAFEDGTDDKPFEHAIVAGLSKAPKPVYKRMAKKVIKKRSKLKGFCNILNLKHLMPTRYTVTDLQFFEKSALAKDAMKDPGRRRKLRKAVTGKFQERYLTGKNRWLFHRLRF